MRNRLLVTVQTYWFHHFAPIFKEFSNLKLFSLISQFCSSFCLFCKHQLNSIVRFFLGRKRLIFSKNAKLMVFFVIFCHYFYRQSPRGKGKSEHYLIVFTQPWQLPSSFLKTYDTIGSKSFRSRIRVFTHLRYITWFRIRISTKEPNDPPGK